MPNSFILFQFTSLDPNREHKHARGSELSAAWLHCLWNFWRLSDKQAFCGEKKIIIKKRTTVVSFLIISFYFGLKEINGPLLYIQLYSLDRFHTFEMKELSNILLMTWFCKCNLENLVIHTKKKKKKSFESDIWFIILPIFHCSQNEMVRGRRLDKNDLLTASEVQMLGVAESSSLMNMRLPLLHIYWSSQQQREAQIPQAHMHECSCKKYTYMHGWSHR